MAASPVRVTKDRTRELQEALRSLVATDVLVGVPRAAPERKAEQAGLKVRVTGGQVAGGLPTAMNNATLAYIHDRGSPAANIPARPFMTPGIKAVQTRLNTLFRQIAVKALERDRTALDRGLTAAGLVAQSSIQGTINAGPPPPLAAATIADRLRRRRHSDKPLVDTGQLRNSISFVLRKKR